MIITQSRLLQSRVNKKGVADDIIFAILDFMLLIAVFLSLVLLINSYVIKNMDVSYVESEIFVFNVMASDSSFAYQDELTKQVHIGIIDKSKFNDEYLNKSLENSIYYGKSNRIIGAKMTLQYLDKRESVYYNKEYYDLASFWAKSGAIGVGKQKIIKKVLPVTIMITEGSSKRYYPGFIEFEMVLPNA